jgi:hypothetical protein
MCVSNSEWDTCEEIISHLRSFAMKSDVAELDAQVEHAELTSSFLHGVQEHRRLYRRRVVETAQALARSYAWSQVPEMSPLLQMPSSGHVNAQKMELARSDPTGTLQHSAAMQENSAFISADAAAVVPDGAMDSTVSSGALQRSAEALQAIMPDARSGDLRFTLQDSATMQENSALTWADATAVVPDGGMDFIVMMEGSSGALQRTAKALEATIPDARSEPTGTLQDSAAMQENSALTAADVKAVVPDGGLNNTVTMEGFSGALQSPAKPLAAIMPDPLPCLQIPPELTPEPTNSQTEVISLCSPTCQHTSPHGVQDDDGASPADSIPVSQQLKLAVETVLALDTHTLFENWSIPAFVKLRMAVLHTAQASSHEMLDALDGEAGRAPAVLTYLVDIVKSSPIRRGQVCEVLDILFQSNDWQKAARRSSTLWDHIAHHAVPVEVQSKLESIKTNRRGCKGRVKDLAHKLRQRLIRLVCCCGQKNGHGVSSPSPSSPSLMAISGGA